MRFLGPHSAGEGPHLVPISLKFVSPSGPHFEKGGSPCKLGAVQFHSFMRRPGLIPTVRLEAAQQDHLRKPQLRRLNRGWETTHFITFKVGFQLQENAILMKWKEVCSTILIADMSLGKVQRRSSDNMGPGSPATRCQPPCLDF